ncbi:MAG: acetylxylan esterase [Opitutaceae bacterium]|nr:acetylxylan esterase [Opitutaceae bacterium]
MATPLPPPPPPAEHASVLNFWGYYTDATNVLYQDFSREAFARLAERKVKVARLESRADWERYRQEARERIIELAGPFPEKTPLNPRVLGAVNKGAFRVEKIVYESQPGLHVTAALFVPEPLRGKAPAIIYCSGHSDSSFRSPPYQTMILNLVQKGFVVLAFDPIGQGERLQYFNAQTGRSDFGNGSSTREHTRAGSQCFLTGSSLARYMIWDGIRSVDYLVTRPEVDPARIGITGRSGGGTQSAYIASVDERIRAAAPENYLTTFEQLLKTRGPQDPEQNFHRGIARGFDQPDFVLARAPKPTLVVATTRDIFSIEGTQALFAEARRGFTALGRADALEMTVDDAEHTSTRKNREATYAFFRQHLELPGDSTDESIALLSADELRITETGQVSTSLRGESVFTLNRREATALGEKRDERRRDLPRHLAAVKADAARLAGYAPPAERAPAVFSGRIQREGYDLEKYLLPVDERYAVPVVALVPKTPSGRVVLYLHPGGKAAQAGPDGEMEWLVKQGCTVIAPDVVGSGELGPGFLGVPGDNPPRLWYAYVLLGKSILGRQMADVMRTVRFAQARFGVAPGDLAGVARGVFGPLLLHTAAIEGIFGRVALIESLLSYHSIAMTERYAPAWIQGAVPGALTAYDLPDLVACVAPRHVLLADPRDSRGAPAKAAEIAEETAVMVRAHARNPARLKVLSLPPGDTAALNKAVAEWLR